MQMKKLSAAAIGAVLAVTGVGAACAPLLRHRI